MQAPRTLAAVLFSAAMIYTSAIALADGHHDKHHQEPTAPQAGESNGGDHERGASKNTPGGAGAATSSSTEDHHFNSGNGPSPFGKTDRNDSNSSVFSHDKVTPGSKSRDFDRDTANRFHGDVAGTDNVNAKVMLKMRDGQTRTFDVDTEVLKDLAQRHDTKNMVFFSTDGQHITSCAAIGQTDHGKVMAETKNSLLIGLPNGESRLIAMNSRDIGRLHLRVGSNVSMTTGGPQGGKIVADDMVKKHQFDKFDRRAGERRVADSDMRRTQREFAKTHADAERACGCKLDRDFKPVKSDVDRRRVADVDSHRGDVDFDRAHADAERACGCKLDRDGKPENADRVKTGADFDKAHADAERACGCKLDKDNKPVKSDVDRSRVADVDTHHRDVDFDKAHADAERACGCKLDRDGKPESADKAKSGTDFDKVHADAERACGCKLDKDGHPVKVDKPDNDVAKAEVSKCAGKDKAHPDTDRSGHSCSKGKSEKVADTDVAKPDVSKCAGKDNAHPDSDRSGHSCSKGRSEHVAADVDVNKGDHAKCAGKGNDTAHTEKQHGHSCGSGNSAVAATAPNTAPQSKPVPGSPAVAGTTPAHGGNAAAPVANAPGNATVHNGTPNAPHGSTPIVATGPNTIVRPGMAGGSPSNGTTSTIPAANSPTTVGYMPAGNGKAKHPTRVLGASIGPSQIALVKPLANTPCVWHKTAVLGASYGPSARRIPVAYSRTPGHRPHYHTSCH